MANLETQNSGLEWMALAEAAQYLNVHPTTLRRWANNGEIPTTVTPGGHRRFQRADLEAFAAEHRRLKTVGGLERIWSQNAFQETRQRIGHAEGGNWLAAFNDADREHKRQMGRRLMGLTMQYIAAPQPDETLLAEAHAIGVAHAENALGLGMGLADALQILQFFRDTLVEVAVDLPASTAVRTEASLNVLRRVNTVMNAVQRGLAERYEADRR